MHVSLIHQLWQDKVSGINRNPFPYTCDNANVINMPSPTEACMYVPAYCSGESGSVRTSSDVSIRRGYDAIVAAIEQRIASWTGAPVDHGERMVVLRWGGFEVGSEGSRSPSLAA